MERTIAEIREHIEKTLVRLENGRKFQERLSKRFPENDPLMESISGTFLGGKTAYTDILNYLDGTDTFLSECIKKDELHNHEPDK